LFTAIIQSIPLISPLTSVTAIIPLIFVLGISLIREALEDLVRHNYDNLNNLEEVIVLRKNKFVKSTSQTLKHGEIILVYENKSIPADMIVIDSGFSEGICYVETSSLDGEKTLKLKVASKYTKGFISNDIRENRGIEKYFHYGQYSFSGTVKINEPNIDLSYINGTMHAIFNKNECIIDETITISTTDFLLKGSILKNTNWIIGIVIYTGMKNKIILNSKKPRMKMSKIEKNLNYFLLFVFIFLIILCISSSIQHHIDYISKRKFYDNFIILKESGGVESFICFFTYFLLLNTLIPISLIVSSEIIKIIQGIYISWDILLYSKVRHCFCDAKSVSIIEELGNVNFIFSDKTGTLTRNQLEFKYCIIENKFYEYVKISGTKIKNNTSLKMKNIKKKSTKSDMKKNYKNKKSVTYTKVNHDLSNNSKLLLNNQENSSFMDDEQENKKNNCESKSVTVLNKRMTSTVSNVKITKNSNQKDNFNNTFIAKKDCFYFNTHKEAGKNKKIESTNKANNQLYKTNSFSNSSNNNKSINFGKQSFHSKRICENKTEYLIHNSEENEYENDSESENESSEISQRENSIDSGINKIKKNIEEQLMKGRNSTILEAKNEDYESVTVLNEITKFGEGFFANSENNPILGKFSSKTNEDFSYIHEFWKALSLTNECMIKEEQGEIKYMGTSPDDLELVKAASLQGYKLIETTINSKTIRISRKDYSYEILKVIGFSSERKRMSIIVKDELGIKLYIKGADCEISKRLSKKSLESENYKIISNGLIEFSKKGLRTLMVAYRKINEEDYNSWVNRLHEDEINIQSKQKMIDKLYDIVENNLILIGGTVVEDKLQEKVPETIKEIRAAGIKIWVLTGDKLDTAENIGHSCNLLSKEQRLFTLKVMPGDDEKKVKEDPYPEMIQFFTEFQEFIDGLVKKYNLETKYSKRRKHKSNNNVVENNYNVEGISDFSSPAQNSSNGSNNSVKSKIIDFETFNYLKEKKILEPFSIIIEAPILCGLFKDEEWTDNFLSIAYHSNTVICCRVSPFQKSQVIQKMKSFDRNAITLAIGDGGNDVSMIMEANIGIGIYGEEGMSAAQASDFSIGEFQLLRRLLFIHGRINLFRISKMILYFFYKNFVFTMCQLYFAFNCLASGQTFIDDWYITCYNLIFTALPLCVSALSDSDLDIKYGREKKNLALLYKENRDKYKIFSFPRFIFRLIKGIIISLLIFVVCCFNEILKNGRNRNIWYLSLKTYTSVLIVVSINLMMNSDYIIYILPLSIGITTFLFFGIFLVINHYGFLFNFNSKASIKQSFNSPLTYLNIFFICSFSFIIDYTTKLSNIFFSGSLSLKLILKKALKSDRKSLYTTARLFNSKSYSKVSKKRSERRNLDYDDKSKNNFLSKSPKKSYNSIKFQECNTPKAFNNNKYKVGPDYKNDFFSVKLLKIKNNSGNIEGKSNKKNNNKLDESND
jgi:phospholipid-translocating ATPase